MVRWITLAEYRVHEGEGAGKGGRVGKGRIQQGNNRKKTRKSSAGKGGGGWSRRRQGGRGMKVRVEKGR